MKNKFDFSPSEYEEILNNIHFTKEEREIFNMKREGIADIDIAFKLDKCRNTILNKKNDICIKIVNYYRSK